MKTIEAVEDMKVIEAVKTVKAVENYDAALIPMQEIINTRNTDEKSGKPKYIETKASNDTEKQFLSNKLLEAVLEECVTCEEAIKPRDELSNHLENLNNLKAKNANTNNNIVRASWQ